MNFTLTLSDAAIRTITLATLEAYVLGDGRRRKNGLERTKLETLGYLWGFSRTDTAGTTNFHIDLMSLSISAERSSNSVTPNAEAVRLKNELMNRWAPHLSLVGDFHSHPYENLEEVKEIGGFEFSPGDEESFLADDFLWEQANNNPVMLAMTICKLSRVHGKEAAENIRANISTFDVGEFRFWLNASVGYLADDTTRKCTGNRHSPVELRLDSRFYNYSRDRLMAI